MAGFELKGKVVKVYKAQSVTDTFKKRDIVLLDESNPQYPEYCVFQFTQGKCDDLDRYKAGDIVTVSFNIKGRAYQKPDEETKYFSNLQGWKISGEGSNTTQKTKPDPLGPTSDPDDDDLPF